MNVTSSNITTVNTSARTLNGSEKRRRSTIVPSMPTTIAAAIAQPNEHSAAISARGPAGRRRSTGKQSDGGETGRNGEQQYGDRRHLVELPEAAGAHSGESAKISEIQKVILIVLFNR
jgi:hypothetical protein